MHLEFLEAHQFRNLKGRIHWGPGLNILFGRNGQGKTNWLEAIYLLSRTKSFRTPRIQESIRFGEDLAFVKGEVVTGNDIRRELQINLQQRSKSLQVNGKREPLARYLGQLQVFTFTAAELEVVRGTPDARRRFLDRGVSSLRPAYVQTVLNYQRVLKQKNRILQDAAEAESGLDQTSQLLEPWNEQLVRFATEIHNARNEYVEHLAQAIDPKLFSDQSHIEIRYVSSLEGKGDLNSYADLLSERLRLRMAAEMAAGHALLGPHRDDLEILSEGREMRVFGSSGQQRSALLLLDLAAISVYNSCHSNYPVFLVDDVDAELDEKRIKQLLEHLEGRTQTFITTSKRSYLKDFLSRASVYEIEAGEVRPDDQTKDDFSTLAASIDIQ